MNKLYKPLPAAIVCALMLGGCAREDDAETANAAAGRQGAKATAVLPGEAAKAPAGRAAGGPADAEDPFLQLQRGETSRKAQSFIDRDDEELAAEDLAKIDQLSGRLREDVDPDARLEALEEIGDIALDAPQAVGVLIAALSDPDPEVRLGAVSMLADSDSPEALKGLVSALSDPDPEVVVEAIDNLTYRGDASVLADLRALLNHPDAEVREVAVEVVEYLQEIE